MGEKVNFQIKLNKDNTSKTIDYSRFIIRHLTGREPLDLVYNK